MKIKTEKEILVAKDATNVHPFWCECKAILVYSTESMGVFYYALKSGEKVKIAHWRNTPLVCTPDGEWIIYADKYSYRVEDLGTTKRKGSLKSPDAELLVQRRRDLPTEHVAAVPVHYGHNVSIYSSGE